MTEGELIVVAIRLAVPLLILRYNLLGGLAAVAVDALDVVIIEVIGLGGFGDHYSQLDKALDTYYLTIELVVAWGWDNPWTRIPAIVFYVHRVLGVILFEFTGTRWLLLVFPNLFENFYIAYLVLRRVAPAFALTPLRLRLLETAIVTALAVPLAIVGGIFALWLAGPVAAARTRSAQLSQQVARPVEPLMGLLAVAALDGLDAECWAALRALAAHHPSFSSR